ncbi:glycosyltransferase family 4 protein [Aeromonas caviae]|uniref:glycosyltransferase family 4 protein n=1 Tax=Aeromonas TaxID=642 RepID=UPI0022E4EB30|nr:MULTISPECIES: glycosyltransferase family 4 protein [Aeromonas]MEB5775835.1 glycosyltransferase family 4 protein [Aeromonas caviae]MEB6651061.1 glycosyltransferase family 4 protein [Aeromonas caviae]
MLKVLVVSNMYPCKHHPYFGIFVKEQVEATENTKSCELTVAHTSGVRGVFKYGPKLLFDVLKKVLFQKFDVIHVHFGMTALVILPALFLARFHGARLILTVHGSDVLGASKIVTRGSRWVSRWFDRVIAVSMELKHELDFLGEKVIWIPCGISDEFFDSQFQRPVEDYVLFPSSPERPEKNFQRFLRVCELTRNKPSYKCLVNMGREEVLECISGAACVVMTSIYEGSPQTIKEALALGTPVVSTPVGDVPLILSGFENSLASMSDQLLAEKIDFIMDDRKREKINAVFVRQYKQEHVIRKILDTYEH